VRSTHDPRGLPRRRGVRRLVRERAANRRKEVAGPVPYVASHIERWEYAARGGLESKTLCWGDEFARRGKMMANTWRGEFPWQSQMLDGYEGPRRANASRASDGGMTALPAPAARFHADGMTRTGARSLRLACDATVQLDQREGNGHA